MIAPAATFTLTAFLLTMVQLKAPLPMLLLERFFPGWGWVEVILLSLYAALLCHGLLDPRQVALWRRRAWQLFSLVFFAQLGLGLAGVEECLMRPERLHLPIPALIAAGPIFRGEGFFMIIFFSLTVLVVGPAWCSHLCYLGAWDQAMADRLKKPAPIYPSAQRLRWILTAAVLAAALVLRLAGAPVWLAAALALAFGLAGVGVMLFWSRRRGVMAHCVAYCPAGLLAAALGKLSPFRLKIRPGCDGCMSCHLSCRFGALEQEDLRLRRPGGSCTLCGDCLESCPESQLEYSFLGLGPSRSRALFVVLVTALQASVLGVARI